MSATAVPIRPVARGSVLKLWLALAILTAAAIAFAWYGTAGQQNITLPSGASYRVLNAGSGDPITPNDVAVLRYKLRANNLDSEVIQDSDRSGQPFIATTSMVYPGFGEALQHMRPDGSYLLWLPPGTHEQGPLPPGTPFTANDTLVFEIQVVQVAKGMAQMYQMQRMQEMQRMMQGPEGGEMPQDDSGRDRPRGRDRPDGTE